MNLSLIGVRLLDCVSFSSAKRCVKENTDLLVACFLSLSSTLHNLDDRRFRIICALGCGLNRRMFLVNFRGNQSMSHRVLWTVHIQLLFQVVVPGYLRSAGQ